MYYIQNESEHLETSLALIFKVILHLMGNPHICINKIVRA